MIEPRGYQALHSLKKNVFNKNELIPQIISCQLLALSKSNYIFLLIEIYFIRLGCVKLLKSIYSIENFRNRAKSQKFIQTIIKTRILNEN